MICVYMVISFAVETNRKTQPRALQPSPRRATHPVATEVGNYNILLLHRSQAAGTFTGYKVSFLKITRSVRKGLDGPPRPVSCNYR